MPSRYSPNTIFDNESDFYAPLRKTRNTNVIRQYPTQALRNPGVLVRSVIATNSHMWKYGHRFYNLANAYYGDRRYWWVIAWYNGVPTEAHLRPGDVIEIPVDIQAAIKILTG